jgi:hypothetical protein
VAVRRSEKSSIVELVDQSNSTAVVHLQPVLQHVDGSLTGAETDFGSFDKKLIAFFGLRRACLVDELPVAETR